MTALTALGAARRPANVGAVSDGDWDASMTKRTMIWPRMLQAAWLTAPLVVLAGCLSSAVEQGLRPVIQAEIERTLAESLHVLVVHDGRFILLERPFSARAEPRAPSSNESGAQSGTYEDWVRRSDDISMLAERLCQPKYDHAAFYVFPFGEAQDDTLAQVKTAMEKCHRVCWVQPATPVPW